MKKLLAFVVVVAMMFSLSVSVFAYEVTPEENALTPQEAFLVDDLESLDIPQDAEIIMSNTYYLVNSTGVSSSSQILIPWSTATSWYGNVTCVMYLKYTDGHTGTVQVNFAQYSYSQIVDGTSRVVDRNLYIIPGNYYVRISNVSGTLKYSVVLYARLNY